MKRTFLHGVAILAAVGLAGSVANAQYYLTGPWNGWNPAANALNPNGDGSYSLTISGTPGAQVQWQVVTPDWSLKAPADSGLTVYNASGLFTANFFPGTFSDGWSPTVNRAGFVDPGLFGYDVMGDFAGNWGTPILMNSLGNGVYDATYTIATAGTHEFKFRKAGDWGISIGDDFSNWNHNCSLVTTADNQLVEFKLDLPDGRWEAVIVPEPSSIFILAGGVGLLAFRRSRP